MFQVEATDGKARAGTLKTKHGSIQTPGCLLYTKKGSMLNLTPDMVAKLGPNAMHVDPMHFFASPDASLIKQHGGGLRTYAALLNHILIAIARDPFAWPFLNKNNNDAHSAVSLPTGGVKVTPVMFMDTIAALQPDVFVALADEIMAEAGHNRTHRSVTRTMTWLNECASLYTQHNLSSQLWAPIMGGSSPELRTLSATRIVQEGPPSVAGYWVCGMGTGERLEERDVCVEASLKPLPDDKPRGMSGTATPVEVITSVAQGVDLVDGGYPVQATNAGWALSFAVEPPEKDDESGTNPMSVVNLWSRAYAEDRRPLVEGCGCFACQGYTRAYVHHLLETHEMLAGVLLEMHNTYHWLRFMEAMRRAIVEGRFEKWRQSMLPRL